MEVKMYNTGALEQIKILVIDDNEDFSVVLRMLLGKDNVDILSACDGSSGLELVSKVLPDIILLDVVMPVLDGFEVCKRIRQNPDFSNIYIVMLSGVMTHTDQMAKGLESGADGYIARPIPNRELVARLRAFIRIKTAEKALVKAETKYQRLFETMIMGYAHHRMIVNAQGEAVDYKFLEINPEFERITGLKREKLLGKTVFEVFPQTEMCWIDRYSKVAFTGKEERFVNFSSDMNKYFEVYAFSPAEGEFSTLFHDVTDRELAKGKLEKYNQNLQQLNNDRNKFFQIIAHDLKSPFNSLLGFSKLLVGKVNNKDYDGIDKYAKAVEKTSRQSYELVINLLEWARTQTGRIDFSPELFELSDLVNKIILLFDPIAKDKPIGIKNSIDPKTILLADKPMINVVLRNLISNAIRFTPSGGEITISDESTKDTVTVKVSDSGIGMANDRLEKLFLSDNIDSAPDTNNQKGTGLGLILCREFVDRHGGRIWAESAVGKGSTFYFTLPYNTEPA